MPIMSIIVSKRSFLFADLSRVQIYNISVKIYERQVRYYGRWNDSEEP